MLRLKRIIEGLSTVTFGVMIVANSVGVLSWRVWATLISLWPLLLVALGIELIGKGAKIPVLRVLSSLLLLAGLLYAASTGPAGRFAWTVDWSGSEPFEVVAEDSSRVDEASARISIPAASLDIGEGSELFSASGRLPYGAPELTGEPSGSRADLVLDSATDGAVIPFTGNAFVDIGLDPDVVWDLEIDTGATEAEIDLSGMEVAGLSLETGAAVVDLALGEPWADGSGDVPINVSSGISVVTVRIPDGVEARVDSRFGLGSTNVPEGWSKVSDDHVWESEGYADARTRYVIVVEGGMGTVSVVRD